MNPEQAQQELLDLATSMKDGGRPFIEGCLKIIAKAVMRDKGPAALKVLEEFAKKELAEPPEGKKNLLMI